MLYPERKLVIQAVLDCQELNQDDPHYGNFFWEKEEGIVEDLNAVEFVLIRFISRSCYVIPTVSRHLYRGDSGQLSALRSMKSPRSM